MLKIPIGVDNFHKLVSGDYIFCDKTAMIPEFLGKGDEVTLITRPRRWGKTLNISMLQHFFAAKVNGISTAGLFDQLTIGQLDSGRYIKHYQGKSPVIMISFKDVNADSFEGGYNAVYELIFLLFGEFEYLINSNTINTAQLIAFQSILNKSANQKRLESSLKLLSNCLYQHHGKKVYILIDEYDTPLNKAYGDKKYLEAMISFMRNLFSESLKGNHALERGVLTGILRVSKDSMLSGLNNLKTYTLLDNAYSQHFGFSEKEVSDLFAIQGLDTAIEQVGNWYNGYKVGESIMYNPWSIVSCLSEGGKFDVYWVNTGNNNLIKESLLAAEPDIKLQFEQLMQGQSINVAIDKHLSFDLLGKDETALWSLLVFAGYLKAETVTFNEGRGLHDCTLAIPNKEVHTLYNRFFSDWLRNQLASNKTYDSFLQHLVAGDVSLFMRVLGDYLLQTASCFDVHKQSEGFYHGFVLALLASLSRTHYVKSNRESGLGRYDVLIIPQPEQGDKAILLEFKHVRKGAALESSAQLALQQIQGKAYHTELLQYPHVKEVVEVGIAFSGKATMAAYSLYDLVAQQGEVVALTDPYSQEEDGW